ncbi:MAG: preprotein translocase subunit SecG, partial [Candidatus Omnitrophota bacterium]
IHVAACLLLILVVLVQQGKGGGLIDTLSSAESIFGTKTNTFLIKSTSALSVIFCLTCLGLAAMSVQRNKSLMTTSYTPATPAQQTMPLSNATVETPAVSASASLAETQAINQTATQLPLSATNQSI